MKTVFDRFNSGGPDRGGVRPSRTFAALALFTLALSACSSPGPEGEFYDPLEPQNRAVHKFNKSVDRALIRASAKVYGAVVPAPAKYVVTSFTDNLAMPNRFINNVLQFNIEDAAITTLRFAFNTVVGLGGLLDVASVLGLPDEDTDFGETLSVWQVGEGAYVELPLFGPNTARGTVGLAADTLLLDPLGFIVPDREKAIRTGVWALDKLGDRHRYADLIDEMLYNSADSYVTERSYYLQNRRFQLSNELSEADLEDPYAQ
jgi:phospholipid-binding lipoprotein MlaA